MSRSTRADHDLVLTRGIGEKTVTDLLKLLEAMGSPGLSVPIGPDDEPIAAIVVVVGPKSRGLLAWADDNLPGRRHGG